ncbi:MAG: diguanylate cyclase [Ilumatobacter sp.]
MRFVRYVALFGSLVLLVITSVRLIDGRRDARDAQIDDVARAAEILNASIRSELQTLRTSVELVADTLEAAGPGLDPVDAVDGLAAALPEAEVCIGNDVSGCTGADLYAFDLVALLASTQATDPTAGVASAVDTQTQAVLVVKRAVVDGQSITVVARLPIEELETPVAPGEMEIEIEAFNRNAIDLAGFPERSDGVVVEEFTIGSGFEVGSLEISVLGDGEVGLADGSVANLTLFAMGAVLLGLAAWTFLAERRQLERRANTDELTGLINRREFERISEERLEEAAAQDLGLCVMVIDLNGFKQINDTLGHQFGDLVLAAASERFVDAVRDTDVVGRWGGDEFVILLPGLAERGAVRQSAERISERLTEQPVVGETTISGSIGAAIYPRHGVTLDALMRSADVAMYDAKTNGVSHRIADTIETGESLRVDDYAELPAPMGVPVASGAFTAPTDAPVPIVESDDYSGPERRASIISGLWASTGSGSDDSERSDRTP